MTYFYININIYIYIYICKVVIYNYVFVGFYSVSNLIVIIVQSYVPCISCGRQLKTEVVFADSSRVSFPQSEACALHITRMRRVRIEWRQLVFASVSRVRPSCEISVKHSILLNYHFWYTLSVPTLYIPSLPTYVDVCYSKRKTLDRFSTSHTHLLERELLILSEKSL